MGLLDQFFFIFQPFIITKSRADEPPRQSIPFHTMLSFCIHKNTSQVLRISFTRLLITLLIVVLLVLSKQLVNAQDGNPTGTTTTTGFAALWLALVNFWTLLFRGDSSTGGGGDNRCVTDRCGFLGIGYTQYTGIPGTIGCQESCAIFRSSQTQCGTCGPVSPTISPAPTTSTAPTPLPDSKFSIALDITLVPTSDHYLFTEAGAAWESIIVDDIPDVFVGGQRPAFSGCRYPGATVDDLYICARYARDDGPGKTLAYASIDGYRSFNGLPYSAYMSFDSDDVGTFKEQGLLAQIIKHEMGHSLGIGSLWLRRGITGSGTSCPYLGVNANREYQAVTGCARVPTELEGGSGTRCVHFGETCLGTELMTGFVNQNVKNPLSRISIATLEDLSYKVDYTKADPYDVSNVAPECRCGSLRRTADIRQWPDISVDKTIQNNSTRVGHRKLSSEMEDYAIKQGVAFMREHGMLQSRASIVIDSDSVDDEVSVSVWVQDTDGSVFSVTVWGDDYE